MKKPTAKSVEEVNIYLEGLTLGIPDTSTDNAVARFDGTGGALQNSGVTIDDNGTLGIDPTAAGYLHIGNAGSGHASAIQAHTGAAGATSTRRWWFGKTQAAETGSNAGSNFGIYAYDDSGNGLGYGLEINRATRKVTVSAPGSTAGLELGSSGPTITTGTGAPSHSAPNGSIYLRTDGTASTTLYVRAAGAWTALS